MQSMYVTPHYSPIIGIADTTGIATVNCKSDGNHEALKRKIV